MMLGLLQVVGLFRPEVLFFLREHILKEFDKIWFWSVIDLSLYLSKLWFICHEFAPFDFDISLWIENVCVVIQITYQMRIWEHHTMRFVLHIRGPYVLTAFTL